MRSHQENPFLHGNFAPVSEERSDEDLEIVGTLPADIDGVFLRHGPNPRFTPLGTYHWFDGDGMVHAVHMRGGRASYRNRWVRTREFLAEEAEGRALFRGIEGPPDLTNPHGMMKNPSNTSFVVHGGKLLSLWEAGSAYQLDVQTLDTRGRETFGGKWKGAFTAHPKVDPVTGEMFAFSYGVMPPYLHYFVFAPDGTLEQDEAIELPNPVMMHDFAVTENFAVFFDMPAVMRIERALSGKSFINWEPDKGARFGVMPRYGRARDVRWFSLPPCFIYHAANAYEDGRTIVLTGGRLKRTNMLAQDAALTESERDPESDVGRFCRFRIDLERGRVSEEPLDDAPIGFETVNEGFLGRRARYNYASVLRSARPVDGTAFIAVRKYDLDTGTFETHAFGPGVYGGEAVFVPRREAREEDAGFLLTLVRDEPNERSELFVLDAQRVTAPPIARVRIPGRVPYGFHARYFPRPR